MKAKKIIIGIALLVIGGVAGFLISGMTVVKYHAINSTCSVLNVAVDSNIITPDQVLELGKQAGNRLKDSQTIKIFQLSQEQVKAASKASNCSQFMVGVTQGIGG